MLAEVLIFARSVARFRENWLVERLGVAQRELAGMQQRLRAALREKEHLTALGTAVAKINHDLRGILSPALLISDRLEDSDDPEVKRVTPQLVASIERAISL